MADDADRSTQDQDFLNEKAIERIRAANAEPQRRATGRCLWCQEPLPKDEVFCPPFDETDPGCKTDYENHQRNKTLRSV